MMVELYKKRMAIYQKKMLRYMKYVFNDHFVLVGMFLLGGAAYYYSEILKTLTPASIVGRLVAFGGLFFVLFFGKVATLVEEADQQFLLPKEKQMRHYIAQAQKHTLGTVAPILALIVGVIVPLIVATGNHEERPIETYLVFLGMIFCLKFGNVSLQTLSFFQSNDQLKQRNHFFWYGISLLCIGLSIWVNSWCGAILAMIVAILLKQAEKKTIKTNMLDWHVMIELEKKRIHGIYRFIHLFTDVPGMEVSAKRRKWLDPLVKKISKEQSHTFEYLFARSFLRTTSYSGLYVRLVVLTSVMLFFLKDSWFVFGVSLLFLYLIGFQLIPIYAQFDYMLMVRLYPIDALQKTQAVQKLIGKLLILAGSIFWLVSVVSLANWQNSFYLLVAICVEIFLFIRWYLPQRLKKMHQSTS